MKSHEMPTRQCPACGKELDSTTGINCEAAPVPGDLSICVGCGSFLKFSDGLALQLVTMEEVAALPDEDRILLQRARRALDLAKRSAS